MNVCVLKVKPSFVMYIIIMCDVTIRIMVCTLIDFKPTIIPEVEDSV